MRRSLLGLILLLSACSTALPDVRCGLEQGCTQVVAAAEEVLPSSAESLVVNEGRGRGKALHAEVHACFADGRYLLVDVFQGNLAGSPLTASIRATPWEVPPCR
jgi:hypothetical protein